MNLYPHQREALPWLIARQRAGFFDDQGLGKTCVSLIAADMVGFRILAVTPTVVVHNWAREAREWIFRDTSVLDSSKAVIAPESDFVSMTHGMLLSEPAMQQVRDYKPDVLILDEAHMLRGAEAKKAAVFFDQLAPRCEYVWCLTGTPQPGWPCDLWRMLHGMWPEEFPEDWTAFRDTYCVLAPSDYGDGWRPVAGKKLAELRQRMAGKFLRRKKAEVLDLPPLRHEMLSLHVDLPRDLLRDLHLSEAELEKALEGDGFRALLDNTDLASFMRKCGELKAAPAAELLNMELDNDRSAKRVVFCFHKSVARLLAQDLVEHNPVLITGDVSAKQRDRAVHSFQTDPACRVAVCQVVAGGVGVTLTAADDALFVEGTFTPGDMAQARDRVYRIGQTKPCRVRFLALDGTSDEILMRVLRRKTAAIQGVLP